MKAAPYRNTLVATLCIAAFSPAAKSPAAESEWQIQPGVRELFLDDAGIAEMTNLRRVVHPPKRHPDNPVLTPDTPWESRCQVYGTAMYDEDTKKFKIWYLTSPRDLGLKPLKLPTHERAPHTTLAAYAESSNGIHWDKPNLGLFPYDGDTQNNLLGIGKYNCEGISVLLDKRDPDSRRRWKAVYWDHGSGDWEVVNGRPYARPGPLDGFYVAFSPDGIHWKPYEHNPVLRKYCDTNQNVVYDPRIKKYVAFSRFGFGRKLARSESANFLHWSEPQLVLECDAADGPGTQIYGAGVDLYEGVYLAMIWIYREGGDAKIDTQLAASRDGIHWTRVGNRATWLELGPDESWEGGMVRSVERIIHRGEKLYIYYCGVHGPHPTASNRDIVRKHRTSVGLLTQRRDGFVSLTAGGEPGSLLTKPFTLPDGDLHLNFDAGQGSVTVTLCDNEGRALDEPDAGRLVRVDKTGLQILWTSNIPDSLRGRPVRLRFELSNASLYAYWWE